jgi:colicin import membrane protein
MIAAIHRAAQQSGQDESGGAETHSEKLKVYRTALGFFDQAIAAPSMKAALEAWGSNSNLFYQGAARETDDPEIVAATATKGKKQPPGLIDDKAARETALEYERAERQRGSERRKVEARREKERQPPADFSNCLRCQCLRP